MGVVPSVVRQPALKTTTPGVSVSPVFAENRLEINHSEGVEHYSFHSCVMRDLCEKSDRLQVILHCMGVFNVLEYTILADTEEERALLRDFADVLKATPVPTCVGTGGFPEPPSLWGRESAPSLWSHCAPVQSLCGLEDSLMTETIDWANEPVLPLQVFAVLHGEPTGNSLTVRGRAQAQRAAEALRSLTDDFGCTSCVWAGKTGPSLASGQLLQQAINQRQDRHVPLLPSSYLDEILPIDIGDVQATDARLPKKTVECALEFRGPLVPVGILDNPLMALPTDTCTTDQRIRNRLPCRPKDSDRVLGVYCTEAPSLRVGLERQATTFAWAANSNSVRWLVSEIVEFPESFWYRARMAHGAILPFGVSLTLERALILGDFGYLLRAKIPLSFTANILESPLRSTRFEGLSEVEPREQVYRDLLLSDRGTVMSTLRSSVERTVVLIRHGHNKVEGLVDQGLSTVGKRQVQAAARWIGGFCNLHVRSLSSWAVTCLTSQEVSTSCAETSELITAALSSQLDNQVECAQATSPSELLSTDYPEGQLLVAVGAEGDLVSTFAACFAVDIAVVRACFWPHASFLALLVNEREGILCQSFGSVSHLNPEDVTFE
ncbi:MAG: uncharacterized protein KVP18_004787 [Porospora cf. gigantea A]|uniref:uncharacterized protein n=2 Tax=Porospora cf. gigantea A TaxID=2853593 RepID=UPI003559825C|nr:MAG: hypothetical protein KVP18_004787 [Porospora cf. gigantea A]